MLAMTQMILGMGLVSMCALWTVCAPNQALGDIYVLDQAAPGAADIKPGTEEKLFKTAPPAMDKNISGADLVGKKDVKIEGTNVTNTRKGGL